MAVPKTTDNDLAAARNALVQYQTVVAALRLLREYARTVYADALKQGDAAAHADFRGEEADLSQQIQKTEAFIPLIESRIAFLEASSK